MTKVSLNIERLVEVKAIAARGDFQDRYEFDENNSITKFSCLRSYHSYLKDMVWKPIEIGFCYDLYQRTGRNKLQKMGC